MRDRHVVEEQMKVRGVHDTFSSRDRFGTTPAYASQTASDVPAGE
jgi:hypothetical protein